MSNVQELEERYREAVDARDPVALKELHKQIVEACGYCQKYKGQMAPSHFGSAWCQSGSLASGGHRSHCSCNSCF